MPDVLPRERYRGSRLAGEGSSFRSNLGGVQLKGRPVVQATAKQKGLVASPASSS